MFILNRIDDRRTRTTGRIVCYGILFWIVSRLLCIAALAICNGLYTAHGIDPQSATEFGGNALYLSGVLGKGRAFVLLLLVAPLIEETLFRLGLSFRRIHVAIAAAALPIFLVNGHTTLANGSIAAAVALTLFAAVWFSTSDEQWQRWKARGVRPASWITAILFGLVHLKAFTVLTPVLLPYALTVCLIPFCAGCVCTYFRINLGFGWGVAAHIANNILPATVLLLS